MPHTSQNSEEVSTEYQTTLIPIGTMMTGTATVPSLLSAARVV
jgi:hypothetical protein